MHCVNRYNIIRRMTCIHVGVYDLHSSGRYKQAYQFFYHALKINVLFELFANANDSSALPMLIDEACRLAAQQQRLVAVDLHLYAFSIAHICVMTAMMILTCQ